VRNVASRPIGVADLLSVKAHNFGAACHKQVRIVFLLADKKSQVIE